MPVPEEELPDIHEIRRLAEVNLPAQYVIRDIRLSYGSGPLGAAPEDFEIVVDYENHVETDLQGTLPEIERYQNWANALIQVFGASGLPIPSELPSLSACRTEKTSLMLVKRTRMKKRLAKREAKEPAKKARRIRSFRRIPAKKEAVATQPRKALKPK